MPLFLPPPPTPPIISDDPNSTISAANTLIANTVYLRAFTLLSTTTVVAAGYRNGATAAGKTNVGIYTLAGNLISDTGQISNAANTDVKFTYVTPVVLSPGQYLLALSPSTSTDSYETRSITLATTVCGYRNAMNAASAGALPPTTGTLGIATTIPVVALYTQNGLV